MQSLRHLHLLVLVCAALGFAPAVYADSPACCGDKPPIRPIDRTCLPAGRSASTPLYRGDLLLKYQEIANVDSYVATDNCTCTAQLQLQDLQAKGKVIGADALIRVRMLGNRVRGYQENPDTPFFDVRQGESKDFFYRATAIKYLEKVSGEPQALTVSENTDALPTKKAGAKPGFFDANRALGGSRNNNRVPLRDLNAPQSLDNSPRSF